MRKQDMNDKRQLETTSTVAHAWREALKEKGYEPKPVTRWSCIGFAMLSRSWRRILRHTGFKRGYPVRVLEVGCGGGAQLVPLYVNGWRCTGVDVSPEVLARARTYAKNVAKHCETKGTIEFECLDFLDFEPDGGTFDLTCQFGVLEHFLDDRERRRFLKKMFDTTRLGGFVVSSVPNGCHPLRAEVRERGLGGYVIPEIDYSPELLQEEMVSCGASSVTVLPHDLFGYLKLQGISGASRLFYRLLYYFMQLPVFQLLPPYFLKKHAYWLIAIARK